MKTIQICFKDPQNNFITAVADSVSENSLKRRYIGNSVRTGILNKFEKCTNIIITLN